MKKWPHDTVAAAVIGAALLLVLAAVALTWQQLALAQAASQRLVHAHQTLAWFSQLRADLGQERALAADLAASAALADDGDRRIRLDALQTALGRPLALTDARDQVVQAEQAERRTLARTLDTAAAQQAQARLALLALLALVGALALGGAWRLRQLARANARERAARVYGERYLNKLMASAQEGICLCDAEGIAQRANPMLARMFGADRTPVEGQALSAFFDAASAAPLAQMLALRDDRYALSHDLAYRRADGSVGWAIVNGRAVLNQQEQFSGTLLMLTDITERKRAEAALLRAHDELEQRIAQRTGELQQAVEALRAEVAVRKAAEQARADSEHWLQEIITLMPIPLFIKDAGSRIVMMNPACEAQWGIAFDAICGTRGSAFFPPEQMAKFIADDEAVFASRQTFIGEETVWNNGLRQDRVVETYKKPIFDEQGAPHLLIGVTLDVTERRRAEQALRSSVRELRDLSAHQSTVKEEQRRRIALDIHDDLGQNLLALKIDAAMLHVRSGARHPLLHHKVGQALATLDATIKSVRAVINELHPGILALGLLPALEWQCRQIQGAGHITCQLEADDEQAAEGLDARRTAALFHLVQEALSNIERHAGATLVRLSLARQGERLLLTIADNGVGMASDAADQGGFGLRAMRERIDALGGTLDIESAPGAGTVLRLEISVELVNLIPN